MLQTPPTYLKSLAKTRMAQDLMQVPCSEAVKLYSKYLDTKIEEMVDEDLLLSAQHCHH